MRWQNKQQQGFTLIELMVSLSIFLLVMTISMGSILSILNSNRKSKALKTVLTNLNLAMETMSKEIRFGRNYHCGTAGIIENPQNCSSGDDFLSLLSSEGTQITYRLNGGIIEKNTDGEGYVEVTAPEVVIDDLVFYTLGSGSGDSLQPRVLIKINSHSGTSTSRTNFTLQTLVSQRSLEF